MNHGNHLLIEMDKVIISKNLKINNDIIRENKKIPTLNINDANIVNLTGDVFKNLVKLINEDNKFDIITVDVNENSANVLSYLIQSWNLLNSGGFLFINHYELDLYEEEHNNPRLAVDNFLSSYQFHYNLIAKRYHVLLEKISKSECKTLRSDKNDT